MPHTPRIIIHGGAGSITRTNLPPDSPAYAAYTASLRRVLSTVYPHLASSIALDAATLAVSLLENDPLFNAGKGAVFTRVGTNELEASVMVSRGARKRGVGVQMLSRVKNPVMFAKELLLREEETKHNCLSGGEAEKLAEKWGCEIVDRDYFWTEKRWKDHLKGLEPGKEGTQGCRAGIVGGENVGDFGIEEKARYYAEGEEIEEYSPQGTVGAVVLDRWGTLCVATSTGGLTNKLPGRIGDTPTLGAGFWAEEWQIEKPFQRPVLSPPNSLASLLTSCLPSSGTGPDHEPLLVDEMQESERQKRTRAVALSGTGNGDYFLRLAAAHNVASRCRFGAQSLRDAMADVVGVGGEMQRAAQEGGRWGTGEGEGGFIGIDDEGNIVVDLNCGGMFRGYVERDGSTRVAVFCDEDWQ